MKRLGLTFGSSMMPTFGNINLISITPQKYYGIADIVCFTAHDEKMYCHRIMRIDEDVFTTKGDNLPIQDYETNIPIENIQGLARLIWRIKK